MHACIITQLQAISFLSNSYYSHFATADCTTTPSTSPEFTCNLGATTTWAAGDIIRVTVPVVASPSPGSILTNVANMFDLKNESASSNASVEICKDCGIAGVGDLPAQTLLGQL